MAPALESPPRGASTASGRLNDLTAKLIDAQAELAAAQDKAEASSAEVLMLAKVRDPGVQREMILMAAHYMAMAERVEDWAAADRDKSE